MAGFDPGRRALVCGGVAAAAWAGRGPVRAQTTVLLDATETVELEHQDRVERMRRAAGGAGIEPPPRFSISRVPAARMPDGFRVETPVLRVAFAERTFFDTASSTLRPEAGPVLQAVADALSGDAPDAAAFVAGHTDDRGSESYNYALSVRRADAVARTLHARGVGEAALWRVGFGEAVPLYPNDSDEQMGFNRRVEFLFSARTEPVLDVLSRQLDEVCVSVDASRARRCRTELELRDGFEAVQLTSRMVGVPLSRPEPMRLPGRRTRPGARLNGPPALRGAALAPTTRAAAPVVARLATIRLSARMATIAMPRR